MQNSQIWHVNRKGEWDWNNCNKNDELILIVAANETYWTRWHQYHSWQSIENIIANVRKELPDIPILKFYSVPEPEKNFLDQSIPSKEERYTPSLGKNSLFEWKEVSELK